MKSVSNILHNLSLTGLLLATVTAARADVIYSDTGHDNLTIVHMTVTPAPAARSALKHRLIISDIDTRPGNSIPYYYRALLEVPEVQRRLREEFGDDDKFEDWTVTGVSNAIPLDKLPLDKLREAQQIVSDSSIDAQLTAADLCRNADWQLDIYDLRGFDIFSFHLKEFQESRTLARYLALRTRLALAEHRYDDAIKSLRQSYRLGVDMSRLPLLVCGLIGIAEAGRANGALTEMIAAPDSPNMYWALAELPNPLIDLRTAARFEIGFGPRMFPLFNNAETTDRSPAEWNSLFSKAVLELTRLGNQSGVFPRANDVGAGIAATAIALAGYPLAKERLIEQGMDRERVEQMAVGQVLAIYTERVCEQFGGDFEKLWYMPYSEMRQRSKQVDETLQEARLLGPSPNREVLPIIAFAMPAMFQARAAQVKLDRELAALRVIEALRMYAASHNGNWPNSLDAVTEVPTPLNPATGKPFVYRLEDSTAILDLPASDGIPGSNRRYELQIAK